MKERPKRRRKKDNPYILNFNDNSKFYTVSFKDVKGNMQIVEISKDIYNCLDKFELNDLAEMNEYDRHIEHSYIYENKINEKAFIKEEKIEDIVENNIINEKLKKAISKLPLTQKRRIEMYYFKGWSQREIAEKEGISLRAVQYTLNEAISELRKILKNYKNWLRKKRFVWGNKWRNKNPSPCFFFLEARFVLWQFYLK